MFYNLIKCLVGKGRNEMNNKFDLDALFPEKGNQKFCGDCSLYPGEKNTCDVGKQIRPNIHLTTKACKYYTQATDEQIQQHLADEFDKVEIKYGSLTGLNINELFDKEE